MTNPDCLLEGVDFSSIVVMDAGTGAGGTTYLLAREIAEAGGRGRILSVDIDPQTFPPVQKRLGKLSEFVEFLEADLSDMPEIGRESLDLVVCTATMCAINDRPLRALRAVAEFYRVLRKGGRLIIRDECPQPESTAPEDEVQIKRWRLYKAVAELIGDTHYTEIHPEELEFAASVVGFRDIEWQRLQGGPLRDCTMEEWRDVMPSLVNRVENKPLRENFRDMITQIYRSYKEKGGRNPPGYVMKMRK